MIIGGLQKFSLLDYPKRISAIIFTQGCNFRCPFCYNPMLVWPACNDLRSISGRSVSKAGKLKNISLEKDAKEKEEGHSLIKEDDLFHFLKNRTGKLEAIVITGGEPTIQGDLPEFIKKIKALGYKVKLDTNGTNPVMLKKLINERLIDYIAMDIKAPADKYKKVVGAKVNFKNIEKSAKIIIDSKLPPSNWAGKHEFRTTIVPGLHSKTDIGKIGKIIKGADKWFLQKFKIESDLINNKLKKNKEFTDQEVEEMCEIGRKYIKECLLR